MFFYVIFSSHSCSMNWNLSTKSYNEHKHNNNNNNYPCVQCLHNNLRMEMNLNYNCNNIIFIAFHILYKENDEKLFQWVEDEVFVLSLTAHSLQNDKRYVAT